MRANEEYPLAVPESDGFSVGHVSGPKGVLALGTAQRNIAAALVVAGQNFGQRNAT